MLKINKGKENPSDSFTPAAHKKSAPAKSNLVPGPECFAVMEVVGLEFSGAFT
jgi:hypothetical protein